MFHVKPDDVDIAAAIAGFVRRWSLPPTAAERLERLASLVSSDASAPTTVQRADPGAGGSPRRFARRAGVARRRLARGRDRRPRLRGGLPRACRSRSRCPAVGCRSSRATPVSASSSSARPPSASWTTSSWSGSGLSCGEPGSITATSSSRVRSRRCRSSPSTPLRCCVSVDRWLPGAAGAIRPTRRPGHARPCQLGLEPRAPVAVKPYPAAEHRHLHVLVKVARPRRSSRVARAWRRSTHSAAERGPFGRYASLAGCRGRAEGARRGVPAMASRRPRASERPGSGERGLTAGSAGTSASCWRMFAVNRRGSR